MFVLREKKKWIAFYPLPNVLSYDNVDMKTDLQVKTDKATKLLKVQTAITWIYLTLLSCHSQRAV